MKRKRETTETLTPAQQVVVDLMRDGADLYRCMHVRLSEGVSYFLWNHRTRLHRTVNGNTFYALRSRGIIMEFESRINGSGIYRLADARRRGKGR